MAEAVGLERERWLDKQQRGSKVYQNAMRREFELPETIDSIKRRDLGPDGKPIGLTTVLYGKVWGQSRMREVATGFLRSQFNGGGCELIINETKYENGTPVVSANGESHKE